MASKSPAIRLTEEETLRDDRVLKTLQKATGGYSVQTVANLSHCSEVQARASLNRINAEQYDSFGNAKLWRLRRVAAE